MYSAKEINYLTYNSKTEVCYRVCLIVLSYCFKMCNKIPAATQEKQQKYLY